MADEIPTIPTAPELPKQSSDQSYMQNNLNMGLSQESSIKPLPPLEEIQDIYSRPDEEVKQPEIKQTPKPKYETASPINKYLPSDKTQQPSDIQIKSILKSKQIPLQEQQKPQQQTKTIKRPSLFWTTIKSIALFFGLFIFIYLLLTFPAYLAKLKYFIKNFNKPEMSKTIAIPQVQITGGDLFLSTIHEALQNVPGKTQEEDKSQTTTSKETKLGIADLENNHLIIPKLDVKTPIIWNSPPDEEVMLNNLAKGVVHYNGTALPDQNSGNVFISGHSSYYWWDKGKYKTVFVNLGKLENGDEIALAYNDKVYVYKVFDKIEVTPDKVEVLDQTAEPILSLMTCVPVGTNLRRLVVKAKRIEITTSKEETPVEIKEPETKPEQTLPSSTIDKENLELLPWR